MKIIQEFKEFAVKGSAIDMAVGIVIGAAFGTVVKSLVDDIISPPLGKLIGDIDFSNLYFNLSGGEYSSLAEARAAGAATINYGVFINSLFSFLIIAFALFLVVKVINKLKRETPLPAPDTKACPFCLSNIPKQATRCSGCTSELASRKE